MMDHLALQQRQHLEADRLKPVSLTDREELLQELAEHAIRPVCLVCDTARFNPGDLPIAFFGHFAAQFCNQTALAQSGIPQQENDLASPASHIVDSLAQPSHLRPASDQWRAQAFDAAPAPRTQLTPDGTVSRYRLAFPLDRDFPERFKIEKWLRPAIGV